jgi:hypothetical protein
VFALPFTSGHVLVLRVFPESSFGPYRAVWHRDPSGAGRSTSTARGWTRPARATSARPPTSPGTPGRADLDRPAHLPASPAIGEVPLPARGVLAIGQAVFALPGPAEGERTPSQPGRSAG